MLEILITLILKKSIEVILVLLLKKNLGMAAEG